MTDGARRDAENLKSCCADLYAGAWARLLLGESFHPGGLALTERLGDRLRLGPGVRVLDVACGPGTSAIYLAKRFGCEVLGVDYAAASVREATARARQVGLADRARFERGDAERVPVPDAGFDAVVCECAFCTFPNKEMAAAEFARALRPGGRVGLADLTRTGPPPDGLNPLLAWIACLGDARPIEEYVAHLERAGSARPAVEAHDEALRDLVREIRGKLLGAEVPAKLGKVDLPVGDLEQAKALAKAAVAAVDAGLVGYRLLWAQRG
jgi:arsenite methyltransferase